MDIEKLICEVQCRTALYNASEPAYANRDLKEQLWKDVAEAMMRPVEECKKKWKTIRDGFMRELKLQQQPGAVTKRKPYIHFAQLTFLIPHVQYKNDPSSNSLMSIDKHEYDEHDGSRPNGSYEVYVDEPYDPPTPQCELSLDSISNMSDSSAQRKKRKVDPNQEYLENRLLEILEKKNITAPQPELDEDEHFFKSLIPTMKKLDPETRSLLKIRIAQMVHETVFASQGHNTMGWGDLGTNGEPHRETEFLDSMASEGMVATSLYTSAPLCSPSRAALLTGRLPLRNGFYSDNARGRNAYTPQNIMGGIADSEVLLPELLAKNGYTNALIGKWHLGHREQYLPLRHGFHHFFGSTNCHFGPYNDKRTPNIPVFLDDHMVGRYYEEFAINRGTGESNMTQLYVEHAVTFIERMATKEKPFFLYWAPDATHAPTYASADFLNTSKRGRYGAAVRELDWGVGQILDTLRQFQIENNTFVVFASDNGAALVSKQEGGSNGPFLCGKQTTFEGGMRSPGIFWWPGTVPSGTVTSQLWTQMDFFTTALQIAGLQENDIKNHLGGNILDGLGLIDNLKDPDNIVDRPVFLYRGDLLMAVRSGPYKMHLWTWSTPSNELSKGINYCPGAWVDNVTTSVQTNHTDEPILYNLDTDSGERYPIKPSSPTYRKIVPQLQELAREHVQSMERGKPQLNWCDRAVMHWAPPGCKELKKCLQGPPSKPSKCSWPH